MVEGTHEDRSAIKVVTWPWVWCKSLFLSVHPLLPLLVIETHIQKRNHLWGTTLPYEGTLIPMRFRWVVLFFVNSGFKNGHMTEA